jgi:hypothetical protein
MGQSKTLMLQQIEFKDVMLTETLANICKTESDCFSKNDFYVLDFFQSSLYSGTYYLSINKFAVDDKTPNSITYYAVINDVVFFVSNKVDVEIFNVLPSKRKFVLKENGWDTGGDYNFLIHRTLSGYYWVLLKTCAE